MGVRGGAGVGGEGGDGRGVGARGATCRGGEGERVLVDEEAGEEQRVCARAGDGTGEIIYLCVQLHLRFGDALVVLVDVVAG
jgi:hypothetical protein